MDIPYLTYDLIKILKERYPDKAETEPDKVGTPEYWKNMGVVQLLRELEYLIEQKG